MTDIAIAVEDPDQPDVVALLRASDAYMDARYPAESNHMLDVSALQAANVRFLVARADGAAVGCASLVEQSEDYAELKRMFVDESVRGKGVGRLLMDAVIAEARRLGASTLRLETGERQPESLGLYRRSGFSEIGPFGAYRPDPLSVFMEKPLV